MSLTTQVVARYLKAVENKSLRDRVIEYLRDNPNPDDTDFHAWAEKEGIEPGEAEKAAYELATLFVNLWSGGESNKKGLKEENADPEQIAMGIKVEKEHTSDIDVIKKIVLDHLAEDPEYYTKLKKVEGEH